MSMPTREELLRRFPPVDDPEILARRQHTMEVLLETGPETHRQHILDILLEASPQTWKLFVDKGRLIEARVLLRRVLARRQLTPSMEDDARIEACTDLATLQRWLDRAITAVSVSDALE